MDKQQLDKLPPKLAGAIRKYNSNAPQLVERAQPDSTRGMAGEDKNSEWDFVDEKAKKGNRAKKGTVK